MTSKKDAVEGKRMTTEKKESFIVEMKKLYTEQPMAVKVFIGLCVLFYFITPDPLPLIDDLALVFGMIYFSWPAKNTEPVETPKEKK